MSFVTYLHINNTRKKWEMTKQGGDTNSHEQTQTNKKMRNMMRLTGKWEGRINICTVREKAHDISYGNGMKESLKMIIQTEQIKSRKNMEIGFI